ncbi:MAG: acetyl esterase [Terrimicrobiaceae bacterium]
MTIKPYNTLLAACVFAVAGMSAHADVALPALISDHAVLQRSDKTRVWGTASPGEKVSVVLDSAKAETVAGSDGKWGVELNLIGLGQGPFEMTVAGTNTLTVKDVVVGEVWLTAGQSNMGFNLKNAIGYAEETTLPVNPLLRHFLVARKIEPELQDSCTGKWQVASPETIGNFTAVGYYFGKKLTGALQVPVGLINSSWGGTPIEAWTSLEALKAQPTISESIGQIAKTLENFDKVKADYAGVQHDWEKKMNRENIPASPDAFVDPKADTSDWKTVRLPGKLRDAGLPDAGVVWLRKTISITNKENPGIRVAGAEGFASVYINGKLLKEIKPENYQEAGGDIRIPPDLLNPGENVIAIRLFNPKGNGGMFAGSHYFMCCFTSLSGDWLGKAEKEFPALTKEEAATYPQLPQKPLGVAERPAHLYNGMIHPLLPMTIKGAIWYQGEHNSGRGFLYKTSFPAMIQDWRNKWGADFPFYFCQLPNNGGKSKTIGDSGSAELREAQTQALRLPKTAQAVLIDIGEADDLHPRNKKDGGERLALIALAKTYGKHIVCSSPMYDHFNVEGDKVRIFYRQPTGGLVAKPLGETYLVKSLGNETKPLERNSPKSELEGFAICGEDNKWVWADAKIDGDTVLVWSAAVPKPVAVRYGWANNPTVNLYNQAGLPAGPFRTDDAPWSTAAARY